MFDLHPVNLNSLICGVLLFLVLVGFLVWLLFKAMTDEQFYEARQDSEVWNISGHVTGQGERWPTHDHHVSVDSFVYPPDSINKEYGCAPPPYTKVDLPTYDEAICAMETHKATTITVPIHGATTITRPIEQV